MTIYHCMIDLKDEEKAIGFAHALSDWMALLRTQGHIARWRLLRRKLHLASDSHRDFMLEIEVDGMADLDELFRYACSHSDEVDQLYVRVHQMIARLDCGLYRAFPDPEAVERAALI